MIVAFASGLVLGIIFFGGLWLTVKKAIASRNTALWIAGSSLIRIAIVLVGFYYFSGGSWQKILISIVGFIIARVIVIRFTRLLEQRQIHLNKSAQP